MRQILDYLNSGTIDIVPLLGLALQKTRAQLIANSEARLTNTQQTQLDALIQQRKSGVPFAYLRGLQGFYHLDFKVTPATLIPRPETELLVDLALDLFNNQPCDLLDLGTGSGAIAITLADKNPQWHVMASDISKAALNIAAQNTTRDIAFLRSDWFDEFDQQRFDLIVSNPPYIERDDAHLDALTFEPKSALVSGEDGLDAIRIIVRDAPHFLKPHGFLLLEHGHNQRLKIVKLLTQNFKNIKIFNDYNAQNRAILAQIR